MGKKMPYWWLSCCLISVPAIAANPAAMINTGQLSETQELPSLNGRVAPVASKAAPGTLQLDEAVNRAVTGIRPSVKPSANSISRAKMWTSPNRNIIRKLTPAWITAIATTATIMALPLAGAFSFANALRLRQSRKPVRAENAGVAQQQANVLVSIDTIAHDTAIAMVQVQTRQQMVETAKEQLDALTSIGTLTKLRNDEGATSLSDVVQTDARIEGARAQLMQYQASLDSSRATLMSMLGWDGLNAVSNEFPQSLARSCDIAEPDDRPVPSVLAARAQANVAQANLDYANAQMTPTVSLEPEVRHYLNDRYSGNETRDRTQYSAWVKVQMPLYQGGGLTARRNAAGHAVESAQSTIQRTRLEVRQKLLEARSR